MPSKQEVVLDRVSKSWSVESVENWMENNKSDPVIVAACKERLALLKLKYLGAFPTELAAHLAGLPDRKLCLVLPLAAEKGRKPRPDVTAELVLNEINRVNVLDTTAGPGTLHTSLSAVRGRYINAGGGSESWTGFRDPVTRQTIAEILGVDPDLAQESRRDRTL